MLEKIKAEIEGKCLKLMENNNAYVILTAIRILSLLDKCSLDVVATNDHQMDLRRENRLKHIIGQTMVLLGHREADARNEALDLLRVNIKVAYLVYGQLYSIIAGIYLFIVQGIDLELDDHLILLCTMLKNKIYFVRSTAVTVLGTMIGYFATCTGI